MKLYEKIAQTFMAMEECELQGLSKPYWMHKETLTMIENSYLPHGSGFDSTMMITEANDKKIIINFDWHVLNENGYYDGWLNLDLIVTPSLSREFNLKIKWYGNGNNKSLVQKYKPLIKDFLYDEFDYVLTQEYSCGNN